MHHLQERTAGCCAVYWCERTTDRAGYRLSWPTPGTPAATASRRRARARAARGGDLPHVVRAVKSWRKSHALSCGCWPPQLAKAPHSTVDATGPRQARRTRAASRTGTLCARGRRPPFATWPPRSSVRQSRPPRLSPRPSARPGARQPRPPRLSPRPRARQPPPRA